MESFEVSGIDQTHDEMISRIEQNSAMNEARMEMALDSVDADGFVAEEESEKIRANELLKQFELEMGLVSQEQVEQAENTIGPADGEKEAQEPEKTLGPKVKQSE